MILLIVKKFSKTSKSIRTKRTDNLKSQFFVEFENPETMEANKEALKSL